jgi:hypothetical protein
MDKHGIDVTVVSTANPWLDFLPPPEAHKLALELNEDLEQYCSTSPKVVDAQIPRLFGFGLLPLVPNVSVDALLQSIKQIAQLPHLRGLIMGTMGVGKGLDDEALDPVWAAIEEAGLVIFVHPHYGVDAKAWGERDNGHVLPLALGFPFETTTVSFHCNLARDPVLTPILLLGHYPSHHLWCLGSFSQPQTPLGPLGWRSPDSFIQTLVLYSPRPCCGLALEA